MFMEHKHLLVNATFNKTPFINEDFTENWINDIINLIDMVVLFPPKAVRCDEKNIEGISSFSLITTSHFYFHSWEKTNPNFIQLDIYSCKNFEQSVILKELEKFNPLSLGCKFLDRATENTRGWRMFDEGMA